MRSYRRMAVVAVLSALAVTGLASCGTRPDTAASVGSARLTEADVDSIMDNAQASRSGEAAGQPSTPLGVTRQFVVQMFVLDKVCAQMQAEQRFPSATLDTAQVAQAFGLAPGATIVGMTQKAYSCIRGIPAATSAPLTQAQKEELFNAAQAEGVFGPTDTVESVGAQLDSEQVRQAFAEREAFSKATAKADVSVNPRYRELQFPLLQAQNGNAVIYVPLGEPANGAVTNAPKSSPSPSAATPPQS